MIRSLILAAAPRLLRLADRRPPDVEIGGHENPYLRRWFLIPRNRWFNIYLHQFCRSDDDRALHDHPWWNLSILLAGRYVEHTIEAGGINVRASDLVHYPYLCPPCANAALDAAAAALKVRRGE